MMSYTRFDMHRLREEHYEVMNATKDNGATKFIEKLDKLRQILEDETVMLMIQKRDNDILSLSDKHQSFFYHKATGLLISIRKGKH